MSIVNVDLAGGVHEISAADVAALLEDECQRRYQMSAPAFVAAVRDGTFDECGGAADLVGLARMLGPDHPLGLGI